MQHPLGVRPAVGVEQDRQLAQPGLVPGREEHGGADLPRACAEQDRPGCGQRRVLGQRGDLGGK